MHPWPPSNSTSALRDLRVRMEPEGEFSVFRTVSQPASLDWIADIFFLICLFGSQDQSSNSISNF
jgi:hypothetical protein